MDARASFPPLPSAPLPPLLPLEVGPLNPARGSGGALWAPPAGSEAEPQPKSNLVHRPISLKIWLLVAKILMILLRINWTNFVHFSIQLCAVVICLSVWASNKTLLKQAIRKKRRPLLLGAVSLNPARGLWAHPANLVHFTFKIWQLVATILIILVCLFIFEQYRKLKMKKSRGGNCLLLPQCLVGSGLVRPGSERVRLVEFGRVMMWPFGPSAFNKFDLIWYDFGVESAQTDAVALSIGAPA